MLIALERIAAHQLGQTIGLVRVGSANRAHLIKHHVDAPLRQLPRGFGTGKTASCDYDAGERTVTLHA